MFENVSPIHNTQMQAELAAAGIAVPTSLTQIDVSANGMDDDRAGNALRAIGWSELTARINAAQDLRAVLRRDAVQGSVSVASFGDAAASYFAAISESERPVNPIDLEGRKASATKRLQYEENAVRGDRETIND